MAHARLTLAAVLALAASTAVAAPPSSHLPPGGRGSKDVTAQDPIVVDTATGHLYRYAAGEYRAIGWPVCSNDPPADACEPQLHCVASPSRTLFWCDPETIAWAPVGSAVGANPNPASTPLKSGPEAQAPICTADPAVANTVRVFEAEPGKAAGRVAVCLQRKDQSGWDWIVFVVGNDIAPE
jgi:hypothetical protein